LFTTHENDCVVTLPLLSSTVTITPNVCPTFDSYTEP
jgi:hypothetical protein